MPISLKLRYNILAVALTKPNPARRGGLAMSFKIVMIELLIGVISSMLGTLILQMLGR